MDNAAQCGGWLQSLAPGACTAAERRTLSDLRVQEPACTYQRVPALLDTLLEAHDVEQLSARGEADADGVMLFQGFEKSERRTWGVLGEVRFCFSSVCRSIAEMQN